MNVLFILQSLKIGGAETFLIRLINELKSSHNITPFILLVNEERSTKAFFNYFFQETGATLISKYKEPYGLMHNVNYKINGLFKRMFGYQFYDELLKNKKDNYHYDQIKKHKIELINSHLIGSDIFAANYLKPLVKKPLVITSQGCYNEFENIDIVTNIMNNIDGMTYVAEKNLKIFNKTGATLINNRSLVYNGVTPNKLKTKSRKELGLKDGDFVIGQVSRSLPSKGIEISIKAVIESVELEGCKDSKLLIIVPENEYFDELKLKYKQYNYIHFIGEVLNPMEYIGIFDIGVLPSFFPSESCPSSVSEYLAEGKAVIATDIGEIPKMIDFDGVKAGKLLIEKDNNNVPDFKCLARLIKDYYFNREQLKKDSELALKAFNKFDIKLTGNQYFEIYKQAIDAYYKERN